MSNIFVTGCGTNVGKTIASAVIVCSLQADYWKPIESGNDHSDTQMIKKLTGDSSYIFEPAYSFKAPLSPHHAARLEGATINFNDIDLPSTDRTLIVETAGGIYAPLTNREVNLDLFSRWEGTWVILSRHYLGSINHTLLTVAALQNRKQKIGGIIFNGGPNPDSEEAILRISKLFCLGRLLPELAMTPQIIKRYAYLWHKQLARLI